MMHKADYVMLAKVFRTGLQNHEDMSALPTNYRTLCRAAIQHVLVLLAEELAADNPNFDRRRFLRAASGSDDLHLMMLEVE